MITIKIPFKTPSVNNLYGKTFRHNSLYLKPEGKVLKKEVAEILQRTAFHGFPNLENIPLKVTVKIYEDWYTKKGDVKKKDIANREKFIIDSVFEALNLDDKFIFEHHMKKVQSIQEFAVVTINPISSNG